MCISDWSSDVCSSDRRFNSYVGAEEVLAEAPEVVVVATGGLPNTEIFPGAELAARSWDILTGDAPVGGTVLLYDDNAAHPGLAAAEIGRWSCRAVGCRYGEISVGAVTCKQQK